MPADMTRGNMREGNLSKMYWVRAMATANYTLNRITNVKFKKFLFELFFGHKTDFRSLRVIWMHSVIAETKTPTK